jgi:HAE1 family hydrophobic/amphiphilic exporter-1
MRVLRVLLATAALLTAALAAAQGTAGGTDATTPTPTPTPTTAPTGEARTTSGASLTFEQALRSAMRAPDVQSAEAGLTIARSRLTARTATVQGNVSVDAGSSWDLANGGNTLSASVGANATFNVLPYGPSQDALERAQASVTRAEAALRSTTGATVVAVAGEYLTALRADQQVAVQQEALALAQAKLQAEQARNQAGAASDADVLAAQLDVAGAADDLASAQRSARRALSALSQTLGMQVGAADGGTGAAIDAAALAADADLSKRADVIGASLDVASARLDLQGARRDTGISVDTALSFSGSTDTTGVKLSAGFDTASFQPTVGATVSVTTGGATSSSLSAGVGLTIPIDGGSGATVAAYQTALELANAQLARTRDAASVDVADARRNLEGETQQLSLQEQLAAQAGTILEQTRQRFELGLVSVLDVQTANLSLHQAQLARDRSGDAVLIAGVQLAQAMALDPMEVLK